MKIIIHGPNLPREEITLKEKTPIETVLKKVQERMPYPIYLAKLNNAYRALTHVIYHDSEIEFLDIRSQACWLVYQSGLTLLYIKAVHDIMGKDALVTIHNSLNKGLFTTIRPKATDEQVKLIEERMKEMVLQDHPIRKEHFRKEDAKSLAKKLHLHETYDLLESAPDIDDIEIYTLEDETQIFYSLMVPSTSYLKYFELMPYRNGVLLRYPHSSDPNAILEYEDQKLLYNGFSEASSWGKLMNVSFVTELNEKIKKGEFSDLMLLQEALHEKKISDIADEIKQKKRRVVLICGPSSSGKTTFAKRLCIQLNVNGLKTLYMGTDDYFRNKEDNIYDENGEVDYESISAVETGLFVKDLKDLLSGKETDLPVFDFVLQQRIYGKRITKISDDEVIVIEGIHSLNKVLTEGIDENDKYKIYISPFTPIAVDHHNRIPTTDARMLRRMIRDYRTRNHSAADTIRDWPKVRKGEDENIFPFNGEADVFFNSNCIYELAVLRKYAEPLLRGIKRNEPEYAEAQRMLSFIKYIEPVGDENKILNNSILREFIGGSVIVD